MKKTGLILFLMILCLHAEATITPATSQATFLAESTATAPPIFRNGKARQPRERRYDKPHQGENVRRNMRIQRRNGVGFQQVISTPNQAQA